MRLTAVLLLLLYFGIFLAPKASPWFDESAFFFAYDLSLFLTLAILALVGVWGTIGIARSRMRREQERSRHRFLVFYSALGFICFGLVIALSQVIPRPLPSGSDQLKLDTSLWIRSESSDFVKGDITPRQKMLGESENGDILSFGGSPNREAIEGEVRRGGPSRLRKNYCGTPELR